MAFDDPYLGEISIVSFNFAPKGWFLCNGQLLAINNYQALFSLIGTTYGGNGVTTFALPNFQGKTPIHWGNGFAYGQYGGEENHTLNITEIPTHLHTVSPGEIKAKTGVTANQTAPENNYFANNAAETKRFTTLADSTMNTITSSATTVAGSNQAHSNLQPYLVLNFIICYQGIFPSRN